MKIKFLYAFMVLVFLGMNPANATGLSIAPPPSAGGSMYSLGTQPANTTMLDVATKRVDTTFITLKKNQIYLGWNWHCGIRHCNRRHGQVSLERTVHSHWNAVLVFRIPSHYQLPELTCHPKVAFFFIFRINFNFAWVVFL